MNHDLLIDTSCIADIGLDIEQYVGLWLVDESRFSVLLDQVSKLDIASHVAANVGRDISAVSQRRQNTEEANIQIIDIQGTMTKRGSSLSGRGGMISLRRSVREAANDGDVDAILLRIDSPGGTVAGTADLAAEVKAAAAKKPVWAFVEDVTASAAYWVASQADKIYANNATAEVGSIGTFMGIYDVSGAAAMQGIKAVVIRSGRLKGSGFPGTEITEEQRAVWQEIVDKTQAQFTAGVADGRKLSVPQVQALAEGRMWLAQDAKEHKLIDGIEMFDSVMSKLAAEAARYRRLKMAEDKANSAATWQELKACCPGADTEFLGKQMDAGATTTQAAGAWISELQLRAAIAEEEKAKAEQAKEDADKQAAEAKAEAEKLKAAKPGVELLGSGGGKSDDSGDPIADFQTAVAAKMAAGLNKAKATASVVREQPDLHADYIQAVNAR